MLYVIGENLAHRTIARLLGAYDVVILDTHLEPREEGAKFAFSPAQSSLRNLVQGVANTSGLNVVRFAPGDDGVSPDDGPMALHVLVGLHALDDREAERIEGFIRHYSSVKNASSQRLLVLTDSVFVRAEPHGWAVDPRIAVVHIEGS
jgi:hypothetical protein